MISAVDPTDMYSFGTSVDGRMIKETVSLCYAAHSGLRGRGYYAR